MVLVLEKKMMEKEIDKFSLHFLVDKDASMPMHYALCRATLAGFHRR